MRQLELTRSGIVGTIAVFLVAAVCVRLGFWQLDRRSQRLERNAVVAERLEAAPVALARMPFDTAGLTHRRATVEGAVDEDRTVVLAGRSRAGQPGVHIYSPVRLREGAVLVNRGWLPAPDAATVELEPIRRPEGEPSRYEGVLLPFPEASSRREAGEPPEGFRRTWFRLDGEGIRAQVPYAVAELYLLAVSGPAAVGPQPIRLEAPTLDAGPHLSYAIQWFSFGAIFLVGWAALLLTRLGGRETAGTTGRPGPYHS